MDNIDRGLREIFRLHKSLLSDFFPDIEPAGLNHTHLRTLVHIAETGPDCMKGICGGVGLEAGSFTPVADRLIREGLVERIQDPRDRRRTLLKATEKGHDTFMCLQEIRKKHFARKLSVLDSREFEQFEAAMSTIREVNRILQEHIND
jgi:DNA-binding MarR family transcriptional regulator